MDPRRGIRGMLPTEVTLRTDGFDGVRVEGKEDNEACRLRVFPFELPVVPLVEGR
jgi:hypothetical protein